MRALHVLPAVAARYGGPSTATLGICAGLEAAGVSVLLATTDADGRGRLAVPLGVPTTWEGVPTVFFRRDASEAYKVSRGLRRWLRQHVAAYDLVHVHAVFSHSSLAAGRACRDRGVPYVVRPCGSLTRWAWSRRRVRRHLVWRMGARALVEGAAAVHYTSLGERDATLGRSRFRREIVLGLGVRTPPARPPAAARVAGTPIRLLWVGRLHPVKNLPALLRALASWPRESPPADWRLVLAGDGPARERRRLERLVGALGLADRVRFAGWVDEAERRRLLGAADLFLLPSLQENFGVAAAEAMAAGVPVLVSDGVGVAPEVRAAGAGWVSGAGTEALAGALREALGAPEALPSRGDRARELASREWAEARVATRLVEVYADLLDSGRATRLPTPS